MLSVAGGVTHLEIADKLGVSERTARRYMRALDNAGVDVHFETTADRSRRYQLAPHAAQQTLHLSTSQAVSLYLTRQALDFLSGTGFREDLDDVFDQLERSLKRRDMYEARYLDRKFYDLNEEAHLYDGTVENVGELVTALLREERLTVRYGSVGNGRKRFALDPYTLVIYRKGLYVIGHSHHHNAVRTFALGEFRAVDRKPGEHFDYPLAYKPQTRFEGAFGIVASGSPTLVRVRFDATVVRAVRRRRWHASQRFRKLPDGGVELSMRVTPSFEVKNWIVRWGRHAEVLEPASLRNEVAEEARAMAARYDVSPLEIKTARKRT